MYLYYSNKRYDLPESWNELTGKQLVQLVALVHKGVTEDVALLEALRILWKKSRLSFYGFMQLWRPSFWNDLKQRALKEVIWVFESEKVLTDQLLPKYRGLYGPAGEFSNLRMIEFHACEVYYHRFVHDKDDVWLNRLVAVLYRPGKKKYNKKLDADGDIREPFSEYISTYYADKVAKWPAAVKQAILMWYDGNRQMLIRFNQDVFSGSGVKSNIAEGMYGVIRSIAQSGIHGDFEKVSDMNVHKAVMEMRKSIEEFREQERQLKQ